LVGLPKNEVVPALEKQLGEYFYRVPYESSESIGVFRANYMKNIEKDNPKLVRRMNESFYSGNDAKFNEAVKERVLEYFQRLRSTTPAEVRVRIVNEYKGESRCVAECRPHFYERLIVPEFGQLTGNLELQAQVAKNECTTLLEELIVKLAGRKDWQSTMNLT